MKRKKELTPCEEKALVHLQALQIKEKEAKAKQRAKKRKVNTAVAGRSIALAGQNLPFQPEPIVNPKDTRPFYPLQNPLPTRNEWNQLIPAAAQTAQFMLLNHAMQQQGIKKDTKRTTQTQTSTQTQTPPTGPKVGSGKSKKKFAQMDIEIMPDEDKISRFRRTGPFIPNAPPLGPVAPEEEVEVPNLIMSDERRAKAEQLLKRSLARGLGSYSRAIKTLRRQAFDKLRNYPGPDKPAIEAFFKPPEVSDEFTEFFSAGANPMEDLYRKWRDAGTLERQAMWRTMEPNMQRQFPSGYLDWMKVQVKGQAPPLDVPRKPTLKDLVNAWNPADDSPTNFDTLRKITQEYFNANPPSKLIKTEPDEPDLIIDENTISRFRRTGLPNAPPFVAPEEQLEAPKLLMSDERRAKAMELLQRSLDRTNQTLQRQAFDKLKNYSADPSKLEEQKDDSGKLEEEKDDPKNIIKEYLKTLPQSDKEAFLQKYGYEVDMHDTFVAYHKIAPVELNLTPEDQDIFQEQYQNWKAVNVDKPPPAIENMTPKTNIKNFLATAPVSPPKAPVAPVSDAQNMLTPPNLKQYPGWNRNNVSTPLRESGSEQRQQAIEMSNRLNNINLNINGPPRPPWVPTSPSSTLLDQFNYNHPSNVGIRAQAAANSQFYKQNELFSQKYVIPRNPNAMQFNMYPLKLQSLLKTHFISDSALRNSVTFNNQQLEALKKAPNESFVDTVDYYLSQNYPKQNQQVIPDVPVNERSGMQPLEIEANANIPEVSENFGSGFDEEVPIELP
jgi:hypothetical protein